jgi:serine/threonine protein kinase
LIDDDFRIRIADFGLMRENIHIIDSFAGTLNYLPPELL